MTVEIVEVIRRSTQGATEPFICRGDDEEVYFVKGLRAGRPTLVKEWVCGRLAELLKLPVAPFEIVDVPRELVDVPSALALNELGAGLAFGSRERTLVSDIVYSQIQKVPLQTRHDILIFDMWIRNYDRSLSAHGGNPNLLWTLDDNVVVMIDHNNAFDARIDGQTLAGQHIFGEELLAILNDDAAKRSYGARFDAALAHWDEITSHVPDEWHFVDVGQTVPSKFNLDEAFEVLCEHRQEGFWAW